MLSSLYQEKDCFVKLRINKNYIKWGFAKLVKQGVIGMMDRLRQCIRNTLGCHLSSRDVMTFKVKQVGICEWDDKPRGDKS